VLHAAPEKGTLKMRDMKQRERKQGNQNAGVEAARKESEVQKMQEWKLRETEATAQCCTGWKMRDMNIRERQSLESR